MLKNDNLILIIICTILFILCSILLFVRKVNRPVREDEQKESRNAKYIIIGIVILLALILGTVIGFFKIVEKGQTDLLVPSDTKPELVWKYTQDVIEIGSTYNITDMIQVENQKVKSISVQHSSIVNNIPGNYEVTYTIITEEYRYTIDAVLKFVVDNVAPELSANDTVDLSLGEEFILTEHVKAVDNLEGDITENVEITYNDVNPYLEGTYKVSLRVSDFSKNTVTKDIAVNVKSFDMEIQAINVVQNLYIGGIKHICGNRLNDGAFLFKIEYNTLYWSNMTSGDNTEIIETIYVGIDKYGNIWNEGEATLGGKSLKESWDDWNSYELDAKTISIAGESYQ